MYLQGSLLPDWESVPERLKDGLNQGRLKGSSRKVVKEDTTSIQLSLFDLVIPQTPDPSSFMPEFQAALKKVTLSNRFSFLSLTTQRQKSSQTLEADSTSSGRGFKPYWTEFSQTLVNLLSLPTKIGFVALGSILSHGSVLGSRLRYWFSTKRTSGQSAKWWKISLPSSTFSVADSTDFINTKEKSLRTVSYRVYPGKELEKIWKKWVAAVRKVYNISIAYLNENQGYTKIGDAGGKRGFRMMLKASGLIPNWCIDLSVSKILDNASQVKASNGTSQN